MSEWPPSYPRVPHLSPAPAATSDDRLLAPKVRDELLRHPIRVEEKLDGANVMLWMARDGTLSAATRGGVGAMDRAGQLGPLRAWAAERTDALRDALVDNRVLYGEWLWLTHAIRYHALPDWFFGFDVLDADGSWMVPTDRDELLRSAGVAAPPLLFSGTLGSHEALDDLLGPSCFGAPAAEGVVVRASPNVSILPRVAKLVAPAFRRVSDDQWRRKHERNALAVVS